MYFCNQNLSLFNNEKIGKKKKNGLGKKLFFPKKFIKKEKREREKEIWERKRRRGRKETIAKQQQQQLKTKLRGAQLSALFAHG
jgi:hypothetical protein